MPAVDQASVGKDLTTLINEGDQRAILRYIRTHKLREPEIVVKNGVSLLKNDKLSVMSEAEHLAIIEQVLIAALDVRNFKLADQCLTAFKSKFPPESARVRRLLGLCLESDKDYDGAMNIYNQILTTNSASSYALKRKYCILRSQPGKETDARTALSTYIEKFSGDASAWKEMGDLCLEIGDFNGATYCWEELVLAQPLDSKLHCKLGELYATLGGIENLTLAKKHMAQSLDLDPKNKRALYGLVSTSSDFLKLVASGKDNVAVDEVDVAKELLKYGSEKLINEYEGKKIQNSLTSVLDDYKASIA